MSNIHHGKEEFNYYKKQLMYEIAKAAAFGNFTLSSGKKSDFYVDCRQEILDGYTMEILGNTIQAMDLPFFQTVTGMSIGADPIVCAVAMTMKKNGLLLRKEPKGHGKGKQHEGKLSKMIQTLLVDDVLTTGGALFKSYEILTKLNLEVEAVVVIVDREENNALAEVEKRMGCKVYPIMTKKELLEFKKGKQEDVCRTCVHNYKKCNLIPIQGSCPEYEIHVLEFKENL